MRAEPLDLNKTPNTHAATASVAVWLDGLGCKMIETEVPCRNGTVVDLGAMWSPTMTEAKRSRFLSLVTDADLSNPREKFVRLCRILGGRLLVAVEVKTSRADFLADLGRKYGTWERRAKLDPPANLCLLACPVGVIAEKEHLDGWSILRLSQECTRVLRLDGWEKAHPLHPGEREDFIAALAERRHNHTQYAASRRAWKAYRAKYRMKGGA